MGCSASASARDLARASTRDGCVPSASSHLLFQDVREPASQPERLGEKKGREGWSEGALVTGLGGGVGCSSCVESRDRDTKTRE